MEDTNTITIGEYIGKLVSKAERDNIQPVAWRYLELSIYVRDLKLDGIRDYVKNIGKYMDIIEDDLSKNGNLTQTTSDTTLFICRLSMLVGKLYDASMNLPAEGEDIPQGHILTVNRDIRNIRSKLAKILAINTELRTVHTDPSNLSKGFTRIWESIE